MTHDVETLTHILEAFLVVSAFFTTCFPMLFAFCEWYKSELGRLLMGTMVSFALAMDVTVLFTFWTPGMNHILLEFWIEVGVFGFIAVSTAALTYMLWKTNFHPRLRQKLEKRKLKGRKG